MSGPFQSTTPVTFVTSCDPTKMIIVVAMFSDIRDDGRTYESSNHSDSNDESTTGHENHFLPHPSPSSSHSEFTNFDNIHMSNTSDHTTGESSDVAERVRKVLDFMSTVNFDLTGFLDALSWSDPREFPVALMIQKINM